MSSLADLEREAARLEREAAAAAAIVEAENIATETPRQRAMRLARKAADARRSLEAKRSSLTRRALSTSIRLVGLAVVLWAFWRMGYETGSLR